MNLFQWCLQILLYFIANFEDCRIKNNSSMGAEVDNSSTNDVDMTKIMEQKNLFDGE